MSLEQIEEILRKLNNKQLNINTTNYMRNFQIIRITEIELAKIDELLRKVDYVSYDQEYVKYVKNKIQQEKGILEIYKEQLLQETNLTG